MNECTIATCSKERHPGHVHCCEHVSVVWGGLAIDPDPSYTIEPQPVHMSEAPSGRFTEASKDTSSGGDNDYWIAEITHPKRLEPYKAECEDLIELFEFSFQEGEAFKALWRKGKANLGQGKPGDSAVRNAEKVAHFGARMVVIEQRKLTTN